jgi:hypothetical protein
LKNSTTNLSSSSVSRKNSINYAILILLLIQPILSATIFDNIQILVEIFLFILLGFGLSKSKFNRDDILILTVFLIVSIGSFFINEFSTFLLNFKIFGLFIFIIIYFQKVHFFPKQVIFIFIYFNVAYAFLTEIFNVWIFESTWFFDRQEAYLYSRPIGFLGSPHSTSTLLAIFFLFLIETKGSRIHKLFIISSLFIYSSWTVVLALFISCLYYYINRVIKLKINPFYILVFGLATIFSLTEEIMRLAGDIEGSRSFTLNIMLAMIFDLDFYRGVFAFFPRDYNQFILQQEKTFATIGNELGFIKVFIEGGFILAIASFYLILKRTKWVTIFFLVTLFHYNYFINMPIILYFAISLSQQIDKFYTNSRTLIKQN